MSSKKGSKNVMRLLHRYLGFFMAGIMAVYSLSGILLIFRDTDLLKKENPVTEKIATDLSSVKVGKAIKSRDLEFTEVRNDTSFFKQGWYIAATGEVHYIKKQLPYVADKFVQLHKAKSEQTLAPLNVVFGLSLLFFVISSFWMYPLRSRVFKKGILYTLAGSALALVLLFL